MNAFDLHWFHVINQHAGQNPALDHLMVFLAKYSLETYAILFIIAWFALPRREVDRRHGLVVAFVGGVIALIINTIIGAIWYRPRPFVALPHDQVHQLINHPNDTSFPSDHTAGGWGFASGSWGRTARWLSWVFTILSLGVTIARVYVGVHWPTDVLAGVVVGLVSGAIARAFSGPLEHVSNLLMRIFRMGHYARRRAYR
ncbi:MAG: phosphatase PAP2 family protein [Thermoflavifilum sp.]|nr:phosphatase PAP2 family protein [Thermoflavifilum sp.]MCL6515224.1 phosphatase PAP2 family protein [Alicyclobacillus sp.]